MNLDFKTLLPYLAILISIGMTWGMWSERLEAVERKETLGIAYALSFLNNKITEQVKINLTIGTEYVKGNNDKATQLLNARQPKDNEPSIKDVISGDYSRK